MLSNRKRIVSYAAVALILGGIMMLSAPLAAQQITYSLTAVYAHDESIQAETVPTLAGLKHTVHQSPQQQDWPGSYAIAWQLTERGVNPSEQGWSASGGEDKTSLTGPAPAPGQHTMHCRVIKTMPSPSDPVVATYDFTVGQIQVVELDFGGAGNHSITRAVSNVSPPVQRRWVIQSGVIGADSREGAGSIGPMASRSECIQSAIPAMCPCGSP